MLSAGGTNTGMTWSALPDPGQAAFPDAHWRVATLERLDLLRCEAGTTCGLPRSAQRGGKCGKAMDTKLRHIWHCRTGAARLRIHFAIVGALARELRSSGGNVDLERALPELARLLESGELEEAIMDLTCWWPGGLEWYGVDVTMRFAGAARYIGAERRVGLAVARGEREKEARYGHGVLPLAFEAGGRLGAKSELTLRRLADAAAEHVGGFGTRQGLVMRWRRRCEAALFFSSADAVLCALGHSAAGARTAANWCARGTAAASAATSAPAAAALALCHDPDAEDCVHDGLAALLAEDEEAAQAMHGPGM